MFPSLAARSSIVHSLPYHLIRIPSCLRRCELHFCHPRCRNPSPRSESPLSYCSNLCSTSDAPHFLPIYLTQCWPLTTSNSKNPLLLAPPKRRRYLIIMVAISSIALFVALRFYLLVLLPTSPAGAVPQMGQTPTQVANSSSYWVSDIKRQGKAAFGKIDFQIFRNVKDFGAKGTPRSQSHASYAR